MPETTRPEDTHPEPTQEVPYSVIFEWDTSKKLGPARIEASLRKLRSQLEGVDWLHGTPELWLSFDPIDVEERLVQATADKILSGADITVNLCPANHADRGYYALKHAAAWRARGQLLVFCDSDVIIADGWLPSILSPFQRRDVEVVCGDTFIEPLDWYHRAIALFWFFPLSYPGEGLRRVGHFFASNVAFRRETYERYPFPDCRPRFRGSCWQLSRQLAANEIDIWLNPDARSFHPPPSWGRDFVVRAMGDGHDAIIENRAKGHPLLPQRLARSYVGHLRRSLQQVTRRRRLFQPTNREVLTAIALAFAYSGCRSAGEVVASVKPALFRTHLEF